MRYLFAFLLSLSAAASLAADFNLDGLIAKTPKRTLVISGDSIMSVGMQPLWLTNQPFWGVGLVTNLAVSGTYSYDIEIVNSNSWRWFLKTNQQDEFYWLVNGGVNNLTHSLNNLPQMKNNMSNAWTYVTNSGSRLIVATIGRSSSISGADETMRQDYNAWLRTNYVYWNAYIFDIDKIMVNAGDRALSYDGTHPTTNTGINFGWYLEYAIKSQSSGQFASYAYTNSCVWMGIERNVPIYFGTGGKTNMLINVDGSVTIGTNKFYWE